MRIFVVMSLVVLLPILAMNAPAGISPEPYCLSKAMYKQFPLVMEEILSHDMDDSFSGYNLEIQLTSKNTFATMSQKLRQLDRRNTYLSNMVSHYIEKKDNGVGKESFILYQDITGSYHFSVGFITQKNSLPQFNTTMIVTSAKNVQCFDAALFLDHGMAIIDCLRTNTDSSEPFTNIFFYVDLTGHKVTRIFENEVYVDFKSITKRKLIKFNLPETAYPYLVRAYLAEGVEKNKDNTYLQIWGAQDPQDLQMFGVIDRTYLHQPKLAINDIQIYNGDIFFLDQYVGLYRLEVTRNHKFLITGKYRQNGMQKFSVYSNDLQDETMIALANKHNIYEIDWSWQNMFEYKVVNKYTIPSDSVVKDIKMNDKYIIVQAKANVNNNENKTYEVDYTWIFTKGSRTYMNAYKVINHNSSKVDIDFDAQMNNIYSADQSGLALFKLDEARLNLHYINQSLIGKTQQLIITATSTDPNSNKTVKCVQNMTVIFTNKDQMKIFETGFEMNKKYSANYPGELRVPLDRRFMGPNITFSVDHLQGKMLPTNWVDKVNQTIFNMQNSTLRPSQITFFHTDMLQEYGQQLLIYYAQDTMNNTHIAQCIHVWEDRTVTCKQQKNYQHDSRISSFATAFTRSTDEGWDYFYLMVLQGTKNKLNIIDFVRHQIVTTIEYQGHQQAQIHHIAASNGYLYVLRKNIKTIDVYSLTKCKQNKKCTLQFKIDSSALKNLGVNYFAPEHITTDLQHPEVLFIKCLGSVVILDVDNKAKLHLLDEIISPATKDFYFRIAVNKYRMVLSASPDIIEEYSLQTVYQKDSMTLMKTYPLYGYKIQPGADIQFSDNQFLVYINAYDPKANVSVVLIYRSGFPASTVLYDVIYLDRLYSRPGFEIQVSGNFVDFLSIVCGDHFRVFRIFEYPSFTFKNTLFDFSMSIKANNSQSSLDTDKISVAIVNYPDGFAPTQQFKNDLKNLKLDNEGNYSWDDRKWFQGHVISYNYTCDECDSSKGVPKIKVRQHIDNLNLLDVGGNDYIQTFDGGIGVHEDLFLFRHNGSVKEIINLPDQKLLQTCIKVAAFETSQFVVTACQQLGRGINLYMTSLQSFKPITMGPFATDAYHARTLQVVHDVVMIVDQNPYPDFKLVRGSVFLYRASVNPDTYDQFDLLDQIDNDDLLAAHGWNQEQAFIANAHLTYSSFTDTFRLYITELNNGFFIVDFTRHTWENELHIISIQYVDMNAMLAQHDLHMPSDATYQAITFTGIKSNPALQMENILIVTKGYHNLEVTISYDKQDKVNAAILHRIYYRYGFYQTYNEVKTTSGYVAIGYTIPSIMTIFSEYKKQYIAVYDTKDYPHESQKGYAERYILGAFPLNHRQPSVFAFNTTYDFHTNGSRSGLIVSEPSRHNMYSSSLSRNLSVQVKKDFKKGQVINITAYSDFSTYSWNITVSKKNDDDDDKDKKDQILFIIVVSVAALFIILFGGYIFSIVRRRGKAIPEERASLITQNQSFIRDTIPRSDNYQPPVPNQTMQRDDSGYSSDQEEGTGNVRHQQETQTPTPLDSQDTLQSKPVQGKQQLLEKTQERKVVQERVFIEQKPKQNDEQAPVINQAQKAADIIPQAENQQAKSQPAENQA